ncbi:Fc.00g079000.m01.CDS01 [Cosmosporella sp. VM-42]
MRGPNRDRMQKHHPSYLALKESVAKGCQLCEFIWVALGQSRAWDGHSGSSVLEHVSEQYPGREISLTAWGQGDDGWLDRILISTTGEVPDVDSDAEELDPTLHPDHQYALEGLIDIFAYPDDPAALSGDVRGRPLPRTAGNSHADIAQAEIWLRDCINNHSSCQKTIRCRLPTHVIDVGPKDGSHEPYLLETHGEEGCYATLSHCWGGNVPLTTTIKTLGSRKKCIPLDALPPTFNHAVHITRILEVRYLWIDSLCILQDSLEDWETESTMMGDIYGRSYLTIAARGATHAGIGCFITRNEQPQLCRIDYQNQDGTVAGNIYFRHPAFSIEKIDDSPLDKRGWVLQERVLSPRILYYGTQQLYWECSQLAGRQDGKYRDVAQDSLRGGTAFKPSLDLRSLPEALFNADIPPNEGDKQLEMRIRMGQWYNIVAAYSQRSLTFESDKLPALAGIARTFHRVTGLSTSLKEPPISATLPSWSWARFSGGVRFWVTSTGLLNVCGEVCEVVDVRYHATSLLGSYGDVLDATIKLKGRILGGRLVNGNFLDRKVFVDEHGARVGQVRLDRDLDTKATQEVFCLPVHGGNRGTAGLILSSVRGRENVYVRLGYISIDSPGHYNDISQAVKDLGTIPLSLLYLT